MVGWGVGWGGGRGGRKVKQAPRTEQVTGFVAEDLSPFNFLRSLQSRNHAPAPNKTAGLEPESNRITSRPNG